jgi:hypothetical protein
MADLNQLHQALLNQEEEMGNCMSLIRDWLCRVLYHYDTGIQRTEEALVTRDRYEQYISACHEERVRYYLCYINGRSCINIHMECDDDYDKPQNKSLAILDIGSRIQIH